MNSTDMDAKGGRGIKKLHTDCVLGSTSEDGEHGMGRHLVDSVLSIAERGSSASRTFPMEPWEVEEWIDGGKLERVIEGFLAGHEFPNEKVRTSQSDVRYELDEGLSMHVHQVPGEELEPSTDRYVLSIGLQGIKSHNANRAQTIFYDLDGIPI